MPHVKHGLGWPRIAQLVITQKTINQLYRRTFRINQCYPFTSPVSHRTFCASTLAQWLYANRVFLSLCGRLIHSFARHTCIHKLGPFNCVTYLQSLHCATYVTWWYIALGIFTLVNVLTFHLTCGVGDYHRVARFLYSSLVLVVLDSQVFYFSVTVNCVGGQSVASLFPQIWRWGKLGLREIALSCQRFRFLTSSV